MRPGEAAARELRARYPAWFPAKAQLEIQDGWAAIVVRMFDNVAAVLTDAQREAFRVVRVHEKWGRLFTCWRFEERRRKGQSADSDARRDLEIAAIVSDVLEAGRRETWLVCQRCAAPGEFTWDYMAILCPLHLAEAKAQGRRRKRGRRPERNGL